MITNSFLELMYKSDNENYALSEIGELIKQNTDSFTNLIAKVDLNKIGEQERIFLTKVSCYVWTLLNKKRSRKPNWIGDKRLCLKEPYVFGARRKDEYFEMTIEQSTKVMKAKNVYFDLHSLKRI